MDLRPAWCNDRKCLWLNGFADRLCIGLMPRMEKHDDLFNNLYLCWAEDDFESVNTADLVFIMECCISGLKHVIDHNLYNPCREAGISGNPIKRLMGLLQTINFKEDV